MKTTDQSPSTQLTDHWAREIVRTKPSMTGCVGHGDKRGRVLGFPTANLFVPRGRGHLEDGVYAAVVAGAVDILPPSVAAVSIGNRPTYYGRRGVRLLEAYILDFDGDLYGQRLGVWLVDLVRTQVTFESEGQLIAQLHDDVAQVRARVLAASRKDPR